MHQEALLIPRYVIMVIQSEPLFLAQMYGLVRPNNCSGESGSPDEGGDDVNLANINGDGPDFMAGYCPDL